MSKTISVKQGFFIGILISWIISGIELFNTLIIGMLGGDFGFEFISRGFLTFVLFLILVSFVVFFPETVFLKKGEFKQYKNKIVWLWIILWLILFLMFLVWAFRTGELNWPF